MKLNDNDEVLSEINVTPLVDVMLVLLVIFMISAPLMFNGIEVKLPRTEKIQNVDLNEKQLILSVSSSGELFFGKQKVLENEVVGFIKKELAISKNKTVFIRADSSVPYGKVAKAIGFLRSGGITGVSLITEIEKN
jgi:biopolymer transport protein ExbD